eukprot:gene1525-1663_t
MQSSSTPTPHVRKISTSLIIFAACVLGIGIALFTLNFWHTSRCATEKSAGEIEEMVEALNRRILQTESQVQRNEILVSKVINALQSNLLKLEKTEYENIQNQAKDEAVRIALYLANHPAPPMPEFELAEEFEDPEKLADVIDDVYGRSEKEEKEDFLLEEEGQEVKGSEEEKEILAVSDAEAVELCSDWKEKYKVVVGVSWGDLPYDLQQRWIAYSCDYHLKDNTNNNNQS